MRNSKTLTNQTLALEGRLRFWRSILDGIVGYRGAAMRPCRSTCLQLDTAANKVTSKTISVKMHDHEPVQEFRRRSAALRSRLKADFEVTGGGAFLRSVVRWMAHLCRHPSLSASKLLQVQTDAWVANQRALHPDGNPETRAESGCVFRWAEGWWVAGENPVGWRVTRGDAEGVRERAQWLYIFCMGHRRERKPRRTVRAAFLRS